MSNQPMKLPREGTGARAVIDELQERPLTYTEAVNIYLMARRNISGVYPSRRHVGYTITRLLKRYGRKDGKSGTKAPWIFGPKPLACQAMDKFLATPVEQLSGYARVDALSPLPSPNVVHVTAPPKDSLVKYAVPGQDEGCLGRVLANDDVMRRSQVMWVNTTEREWVPWNELKVYKDQISKLAARVVVQPPKFKLDQKVVYCGAETGMQGVEGRVNRVFPNARYSVIWTQGWGPSTEDEKDLKAADESPLKVGTNVSCKKGGLTFPAKVFVGPMSTGEYKVVCPNGTYEWVTRSQMTVVPDPADLYQATPQKPSYGQPEELPLSERSQAIKDNLFTKRNAMRLLEDEIMDLEDDLRDSIALDREEDWARKAIGAFSSRQKQAMLNVLKGE